MGASSLGYQNVPEALSIRRLAVVEKLQAVHVFKIEMQRAFGSVDLNFDMILAAEGETGGFQIGEGAILESSDKHRGVIHGDLAHFTIGLSAQALAFAGIVH